MTGTPVGKTNAHREHLWGGSVLLDPDFTSSLQGRLVHGEGASGGQSSMSQHLGRHRHQRHSLVTQVLSSRTLKIPPPPRTVPLAEEHTSEP